MRDAGFFVISFDHRDVGKSSLVNSQEYPYTLKDMVDDALKILDAYEIPKAHIVGLSMGGFIAQMLAINHPERVLSLVSMMSSPDHSVMLAALAGEDTGPFSLPPPPAEALETWAAMKTEALETKEDRITLNVKNWKLCSGIEGYDEHEFRKLEEENVQQTRCFKAAFNHWSAMTFQPNRIHELASLTIPTLVIHGGRDVVLPVEHGKATAETIGEAELKILPNMGHALCEFY